MKINADGMRESGTCNARIRREYPIFNPSDYVFHGYPHHMNQSRVHNLSKKYQSPIFEHRTKRVQKCVGN